MLVRIRLIQFRRYRDQEFSFSDGLNIIIGENGTGKSSLLEAIGILLFNAPRTSLKDAIQKGKDYATLIGEFYHNDTHYKVTRSFGSITEYILETESQRWEGKDTVTGKLSELFGPNLSSLYNDVLAVRQFSKLAPFDYSPNERLLMFGRILGIEKYEQEYEYLKEVLKVGQKERDDLYNKIERTHISNKEVREHNEVVDRAVSLIPTLRLQLETIKGQVANLYMQNRGIKDRIAKNEETQKEITKIQVRLEEIERQLSYPAIKQGDYEAQVAKYQEAKAGYEDQLAQFNAEKVRLAKQHELLLRTEAVCPVCGEPLGPVKRAELLQEVKQKETLLTRPSFNVEEPKKPYRWDDGFLEGERDTLLRRLEILKGQVQPIDTSGYEAMRDLGHKQGQLESQLASYESLSYLQEEPIPDTKLVENTLDYLTEYRKSIKERISSVPVEARRVISEYASELYKNFMEGHHEVSLTLDNSFGIVASIRGSEVPFSSLSGAEGLLAALAVRMAIVYYLARDLRMFFLDEPTEGLDKVAMPEMAHIIEGLPGQVFVVTHQHIFNTGNIVEI